MLFNNHQVHDELRETSINYRHQDESTMLYQVSSHERENLDKTWSIQTHAFTRNQQRQQRKNNMIENDFAWIHSVKNFAWSHIFVNIHETMMINVLHQLLKKIILYLMLWLSQIINESVCTSQRRKEIRLASNDASEKAQLNQRFHVISSFKDMKKFVKYSTIKQWTDADWKLMIYQLISVIASLLITKASAAIHFAQAVINFVILAQYHLHDEETVWYLKHALFQLNKLKNVFHHLQSEHSDTDIDHFNISKLHAMTHYASQIWRYNSADNFNTKHSEIAYKHLIKIFFDHINKWEMFQR